MHLGTGLTPSCDMTLFEPWHAVLVACTIADTYDWTCRGYRGAGGHQWKCSAAQGMGGNEKELRRKLSEARRTELRTPGATPLATPGATPLGSPRSSTAPPSPFPR